MFRLSTSFALFVLIFTLTVATQQASGLGAAATTSTTSTSSSSSSSSNNGGELITPKPATKLPGLGTSDNEIPEVSDVDLIPRKLANKNKTTGPDSMDAVMSAGGENRAVRSGRIVVKFRDEYKVRCSAGIAGGVLTCASTRAALAAGNAAAAQQNNPIASAISLVNRFSGTVQPAINKTEKQLAALEIKASSKSGKAQPDLAGYMFITVPPSALSSAAEAFNELDCVEFAQVDYLPIPAQCPDRDLSLQKGPAKEGADIGINCQISTDALGVPISCPPPGPIFCALLPFATAPLIRNSAFSLTGGLGAITCSRPSRWTGYNPQYTTNPPPTITVPPTVPEPPPGCTIFTEPGAVFPPTWDCQQGGCNLGGGLRGRCVEPPTGFTSVADCQYGCRNSFCAEYLATTLGWSKCIDQLDGAGWDSICATLANIYCPTIINSPTPYNNSGAGGGGSGMPQVDLPTETCFGVSVSAVTQEFAFDDTEVFDACFALRGPAFPSFVGTKGVLKFTDIGNGDGIRPWGFTGVASAFAFPFLNQTPANLTDDMNLLVGCNNIIQYSPIRSRFLAGGTLNSIDPTLPESAGLAEYDNAFKSFPYALSHNCFTAGNSTPGCTNTKCCVFVCINDSSCCSIGWDASCVTQAETNPDLCQTGGFVAPVIFNPPLPNPGIPSFDPVEIGSGATVNFRARNLALFRTKLPNVLSSAEYISAIETIARGSLTPTISTPNSLVVGLSYQIFEEGVPAADWLTVGAASTAKGTIFTATQTQSVGTATGRATVNAQPGIIPVAETFAQSATAPIEVTDPTFATNQCYRITSLGTTTRANWLALGAPTNAVGAVFVKTAVAGAGTGTVTLLSLPLPLDESYDFVNTGFSGGGIDVAGMQAFTAGITRDGVPLNSECILGSLTRVGVIDYSAIVDHLDLLGQVTVETGQTIVIPAPGTSTIINPNHGTAVLGVLVAADNGFGITGLLPRSQAIFFPAVTSLQGGRVASALVSAGETLGDGDVLCIPLEYGIGYTLATDPFVSQLFNVVDSLGATIVIPAGNGGFPLQTFAETTTTAIVVGSVWPGRQIPVTYGSVKSITSPGVSTGGLLASGAVFPGSQYCRYPSSNWSETVGEGGIDVAGWGTAICTLGEGTLFNNATSSIPATPQQDYQASFGQTSGACAMIAGLIGALNGFSEEVFDGSIGTQRIRYILNNFNTNVNGDPVGNNLGSVVTQCGFGVGVEFPSTVSDSPNVVSNGDNVLAGGTQHNVGGFPLASVCLENVFINESYPGGTPFGMQVITGTRISGNKFSIGTLNNKFLQIQAQQKGRGSRGSGYGPSIQYVSMGLATDVQIRATLLVNDIALVNDVAFAAYGLVTGGSGTSGTDETGQAMGIMYAYNRKSNRWAYLDFGFLSGIAPVAGGDPNLIARLSSTGYIPQDFVVTEGSENVIYTRFITFGFGVIGPYRTFWDQILIQLNPPAGTP